MSKYKDLSKEELLKLIEKQEAELKSKKYGLVWDAEREPEQVVLDCESNLPVLKRVKGKEIRTNDEEDNILIEGDNYHALTVLNYTHKEKIDVIYIDPPYNTGNKDFVYNDRYVDKEDGYRHSKWLNFMEKRLNLAKNLLKETGVIFISIDDNEFAQLKMLCDKIFGEDNFIANLIWKSKSGGANDSRFFAVDHEYVFIYAKNNKRLKFGLDADGSVSTLYNLQDENGWYSLDRLDKQSLGYLKSLDFPIKGTDGRIYTVQHKNMDHKVARWRWGKDTVKERLNELVFKNGFVYTKNYKKEGVIPRSLLIDERFGRTRTGKTELFDFFKESVFSNPKPSKLIYYIIGLITDRNAVILDFVAGSGTTGHAVLKLNKKDGGSRKFILCTDNQLNGVGSELVKNNPEENKDEFGICRRVTYPRLEKVIKGYQNSKAENVEGLGGNLQYFKTALIKKTKNKDQVVVDLTQKCTEMLCVRENIFNFQLEKEDYKIFSSHKKDKFLCVYYNFFDDSFADFLKEIKKLSGKKKIYIFSIDGKIDQSLFAGVADAEIEEIPQKILEIYKQLVKMNIPVKAETIFADLDSAKIKIFTEKEKNEGARILRIVLEKLIQKIAQNNGISILKNNAKEEKCAILNDKLKSENIFSKVDWQENSTYLTIGNHASHGEYDEFDLKNVENFYGHLRKLIDSFNI